VEDGNRTSLRVVIAEDSAVVRALLAEILADRGHEVVAAVGGADALQAAVAAHRPDVAVVDVRMPPGHTDEGLRAAIAIRRDQPGVGILVFSQYVETRHAADLLAAPGGGASGVGYLLKDRVANVGEFTDALSRVAAGGTAFDPQVVTDLLTGTRHGSGLASLTAREHEVLALMPEAGPMPASKADCWSPSEQWRSTSATSSPSSTCHRPTSTTAACSPCLPTFDPDASRLAGMAELLVHALPSLADDGVGR
jgi:DNA-binding NarL/FixJ family response regulator